MRFDLFVHGELASIYNTKIDEIEEQICRIKLLKKISACMSGKGSEKFYARIIRIENGLATW